MERFGNRRALANYLGLTPRSHESGERVIHQLHRHGGGFDGPEYAFGFVDNPGARADAEKFGG